MLYFDVFTLRRTLFRCLFFFSFIDNSFEVFLCLFYPLLRNCFFSYFLYKIYRLSNPHLFHHVLFLWCQIFIFLKSFFIKFSLSFSMVRKNHFSYKILYILLLSFHFYILLFFIKKSTIYIFLNHTCRIFFIPLISMSIHIFQHFFC